MNQLTPLDYATPGRRSPSPYRERVWFWVCYLLASATVGPIAAVVLVMWKLRAVRPGDEGILLSIWLAASIVIAIVWSVDLPEPGEKKAEANRLFGFVLGVLVWVVAVLLLYLLVVATERYWFVVSWP
jgi:hypothetical protein